MPIRKLMKSVPSDILAAEGIFSRDTEALTPCQRESIQRLAISVQLEQESYFSNHPELIAMSELFISKVTGEMKRKVEPMKQAADFFLRPLESLNKDIRKRLEIAPYGSYAQPDSPILNFDDHQNLINDLLLIQNKHFPPPEMSGSSSTSSMHNTESSSFISVETSDTTLPTPEPIRTPEPTLSKTMFNLVSNTVDKAIFLHVDDATLRYDTAYVELSKAVEAAMEIPVIEIRECIAQLLANALQFFEMDIMEKERIAAEVAWEKRMRKKMKRTLRRQENFKGYVTPPTPQSTILSHESYTKPPPRPCICLPQIYYNRYAKDRFGIYLPRDDEEEYDCGNVTVTPIISMESIQSAHSSDYDNMSASSKTSKKSALSTKSVVSQKRATKYQYTN